MYKSLEDIIQWLQSHKKIDINDSKSVENFVRELHGQIKQMDFRDPNGSPAMGYSGWLGSEKKIYSAIYKSVENLSKNSNRKVGLRI